MISGLLPGIHIAFLGAVVGLPGPVAAPEQSPQPTVAQPEAQAPEVRPEDVQTLEGLMKAFYESTAGPPGQPREWDRLRSLCSDETRFLAARPGGEGRSIIFPLSVEDYIMHNRRYFENGGFFESEIARRTESFGNIVHIWSTYESRRGSPEADPYTRGIYSVQILKDGERWWILSVLWDNERPENPLPAKYLETPEE